MTPRYHETPLAIIGMACRVPGADNLDQFWQLLVEGRSAVAEAPPARINRQLYFDPDGNVPYKTYTVTGGMIEYPPFDFQRCPVPKHTLAEAEIGHHTICQIAADACRDAGLNPFDLPLRNAGVYVGHNLGGPVAGDLIYSTHVETTAQYLRELDVFREAVGEQQTALIDELVWRIRNRLPKRGPTGSPEGATRLAAAIISESLGLTGPSIILDAACSSALQGLVMAGRGLQLGRIDMAVVAGASYFHCDSQLVFSKAQSASRRACSSPFDADADGLVSGEGYVAVLVKTLDRALADGDPIRAVIRGIGVSSDGRGKSLWAPRKEGQVLAMRRAYHDGLDVARLQYIEAHATSTRVGDMTELKALAEVLDGRVAPGTKIPMGGVKANIGHTLESAGLCGLVKTVLAMEHETVPRQINVTNLNPGIDWDAAPFYVPLENVPWPEFADGHPRRAAVNSFGIGGLNVHVVIDQHVGQAAPTRRAAARPATESINLPATESIAAPAVISERTFEPIAIVGAGCIFPGARTLAAFWELIASGRDPKCDVPTDRWDAAIAYEPGSRRPGRSPSRRGGFVTDFVCDWRRHKIPPNQVDKADPLQLMILDATDAALADAGYDKLPYDKSRTGVVVGTMFGSDFCEQLQMGFRLADFCDSLGKLLREKGIAEEQVAAITAAYPAALVKHMTAILDETGGFTPSTLASRLTKMYDLMGGAVTIDAGQASSLAAIYSAVDTLLDGTCDMVVCAAGHRAMGLTTYEVMSLAGLLADDTSPAPFDAQARGHLPGEGVGVVVLKRLSDALRDGNPIRGIIRGVGAGFSPDHRAAVDQAIRRAQSAAGAPKADELLLETCGAGDPQWDEPEMAAVADALAIRPRSRPLPVSSLVGQIGHTQGASGMASLLAALHSLETLEVAPRVGMNSPSAPIAAQPGRLRLANQPLRLEPAPGTPEILAGVNSLDIYGSAYHLVLERPTPTTQTAADDSQQSALRTARPPSSPSQKVARQQSLPQSVAVPAAWRIVRLAAPSLATLAERARAAVSQPAQLFADSPANFGPTDVWRLAIVAGSAADLAEKLQLAAEGLGTPKAALLARKDIFVGEASDPAGKVAFLFSGQGSQYAGMLKPLVTELPAAAKALEEIDAELIQLGLPKFSEFAWDHPEALGRDVWITQLALLAADTIVFRSLAALGIEPDIVAGHSFGEFPALIAAGSWDFASAVLGTRARCQAIEACGHIEGGMISVAAAGPVVEALCREEGRNLFAANYNAPDQTVVGGDMEGITRLESRLKAEKIAGKRLAVPRPFHTPLMADTQPLLAASLASIDVQAPRRAILSSVTNNPIGSADEVRANLVAQMTSPVRYVDLIDRLVNQGVQALVEVGPHQVLTGLNQKILAGQGQTTIASDDKARGGLARLLAVRAALEVRGLAGAGKREPATTASVATTPRATERNGHTKRAQGPAVAPASLQADHPVMIEEHADAPAAEGVHVFAGSAYEIGWAHGQTLAADIRAVARRFADTAGFDGQAIDGADGPRFDSVDLLRWHADEQDELRGLADGAGVSAEMLSAYNAWADAQTTEATLHVGIAANADSPSLHAFEQQSAPQEPWGDLEFQSSLRVYRPIGRLAHLVVAAPGLLGAAVGLNESGLAVSSAGAAERPADASTTLRTLLVRQVLGRAADIDAALEILRREGIGLEAEFYLSHPTAGRVLHVRLAGRAQTVTEHAALASANFQNVAVLASAAPTGSEARFPAELLALADQFAAGQPLGIAAGPTLHSLAASHLAVVLHPARREAEFRPGPDRPASRFRFAVRQTSPPSEAPAATQPTRIAGQPPRIPTIPLAEYFALTQSVAGKPPIDLGGRVCQRFVARTLRSAMSEIDDALRKLNGPALVVGRNAVTNELRKQIEAFGGQALVVPLSDDIDKTLSHVDAIWQAYQPPHLFLVTAWDSNAATELGAAFGRRRRRGVTLPYRICQRWLTLVSDNNLLEKSSVVAATVLGGDFGLSGNVTSVESGALAGLVKGLNIEMGLATKWTFRCKLIDAAASEPPAAVAEAMLRELRARSPFLEIGCADGRQYGSATIPKPAEPRPDNAPTRGRPWLLTGGARGITATIAQELGGRFGVKLHLVGTSPRRAIDPAVHRLTPDGRKELRAEIARAAIAENRLPADAWKSFEKALEIDKNLREMEAAGIQVVYYACDVTDRAALGRLIDEIRRVDGPLEGIVHGAGIEVAARFTKKDPQLVEQTLASKVDGAALLMELTRPDPLRFFVGFGSISGRWGSIGQTDYCAASDMLAKLIEWFRRERPDCHSTCFHWQPWADVGMAARDETRGGQMLQGLDLLPPAEGAQHFVDELLAGCPEPEVVVTDWNYYKRYNPDLPAAVIAEAIVAEPPEPVVEVPSVALEPTQPVAAQQIAHSQIGSGTVPSAATMGNHIAPLAPTAAERADQPPRVARRQVMRLVDVPRASAPRRSFAFAGPALVLGDNADATALLAKLHSLGVPARQIPICDSVDQTLSELQWMFAEQPAPHLFVVTAREPAAAINTRDQWLRRRDRGVLLPFAVCQKWLAMVGEANLFDRASLVAATALGGDFGFAAPIAAPEGGALTGLLKGLYMELTQPAPLTSPRIKLIDAPADESPERLADEMIAELSVAGFDVEVAVAAGRRRVVRLLPEPVESLESREIAREGTWIFTGGARGITAAVAKQIARRYALKVHLLGASPKPELDDSVRFADPAALADLKRSLMRKALAEKTSPGKYWDRVRKDLEIDQTLRELAAAGVKATYHQCDVTSWDELSTTLDRVRAIDGPIEGIVHGAGVHGTALTNDETPLEIASEMVAIKVDAALNLMWLTGQDPVRYFVGFGSISGRFGSANASVYTLGSDMLAKAIGWYRTWRPDCHAVGFHWHPWGEVGMMTRPVSQHTIKVFKMKMMPPAEGAAHLVDELSAGAPESEVLITDSQFGDTFCSPELVIAAEPASRPAPSLPEGAQVAELPGALVARVVEHTPPERAVTEIRLHPMDDPFLREHRLRDRPLLPLVVALEAFAETAVLLGACRQVVACRDVRITDAVRFFADEPLAVRVSAESTTDGIECRLTSDFRNRRGQLVQKDRPHFAARLELGAAPVAFADNIPDVPGEWFDVTYPPTGAPLYHGPPLRLLKRMAISPTAALGEIHLPARDLLPGARHGSWLTPSAALDACLYACGVYSWVCGDRGFTVPAALSELRFGRPGIAGEVCLVNVVCRELEKNHGLFDFTLFGADRGVIFAAHGYRCHVLRGSDS